MNPDEMRDLLGAYAIGAIDDDAERERVQRYLLADADARAELHELEHAVAWLGHASPQPSAQSWDIVRLGMEQDLVGVDPARSDGVQGGGEPADTGVTSMSDFKTRRATRYWKPLFAVAAVVLLFLAIGGVASLVGDSSRSMPTQRVALSAPDGSTVAEVTLRLDGTGTIQSDDLPKAPAGLIYQLWAQTSLASEMRSAGLLGDSVHDESVRLPKGAVRIAISVEPDGGSVRPTTNPVALSSPF